nr:MAG TPA: hypothetical protein [Caudoviricetes sp.]
MRRESTFYSYRTIPRKIVYFVVKELTYFVRTYHINGNVINLFQSDFKITMFHIYNLNV